MEAGCDVMERRMAQYVSELRSAHRRNWLVGYGFDWIFGGFMRANGHSNEKIFFNKKMVSGLQGVLQHVMKLIGRRTYASQINSTENSFAGRSLSVTERRSSGRVQLKIHS
jgi:hypothetical protein